MPTANWVVLAIGGARGITAEVLSELVVPGMTLVLVGRSPLPELEPAETRSLLNPNELQQGLIQQARAAGKKVTPAQIQQQSQQIQRSRAIRQTLAAFAQAGAVVDYRAVDMRDEAAVAKFLPALYQQYGRLDAVLQGAGIIEDKRLIHKQPASFERVFDTKADSTFLLSRYLRPECLKLVLLFASVAGRTGNQGQADYAAANEVVNRLAWWMQQHWTQTRVLSINWGPWAMTGMASDEVNRQFRDRGVIPIPPAAGRQYVIDELQRGHRSTVEVIVGLFDVPAPVVSSLGPLLSQPPQLQPTGAVSMAQTFTLKNNPYLKDHCLDGQPVLAAAAAQEWLAQFVQSAWPDWVVCEVRNLRVLGGIVLKTPVGVPVQMTAKASTHASSEALEVTAEIKSATSDRVLYRGTFILRSQLPPPPVFTSGSELIGGHPLEAPTAYEKYCFHGPLFQLITQIQSLSDRGIDALVRPSSPAVWLERPEDPRPWLFDPGLIDASLQMGLIFTRTQGNTSALPTCFGRVIRYRPIAPAETIKVLLRVNTFTDDELIYDADLVDQQGRICLTLLGIEAGCSPALNRLRVQSSAI